MKNSIAVAVAMIVLLGWGGLQGAIVNNSTDPVGTEDSLTVAFVSLDSLGSPTTADSVYLVVCGPSGAVVFSDYMTTADSRVVSTSVRDKQFYNFKQQVSDIDGAGDPGVYSWTLVARNNSLELLTTSSGSFQIISRGLSDQLQKIEDSVLVMGGYIDTNLTAAGKNDSTELARWVWNTPQANHTVGSSFGKYLDTEVSGVSAGGLDSADIAAWIWNTPQANHTVSGSFGDNLDAEISGLASGSGSYAVTLYAVDTSAGLVIPGVSLAVRNLAQSALLAAVVTDPDGAAVVNLDAGDYLVIPYAAGYAFGGADTLSVSGAAVDSILGAIFDPGAPSVSGLCRVYGYLFDAAGQAEEGATVAAVLPSGTTTHGDEIIVPNVIATESDTSGYFYLDLFPSDSLGAGDVTYEFTIYRTSGAIWRQSLTVPDSTTWRLRW